MIELDKVLLHRIIHIDNLNFILKMGKLMCPNHLEKDQNYIGIGDSTLISSRSQKEILLHPFGTFLDYISFYFTNRSPMLYNIAKGFNNVIKRNQDEIIYLVSNFKLIKDSKIKFVFFDGHGFHHYSECYNDELKLHEIDWEVIKSRDWFDTESDSDRKRKKQAELLVYNELSIEYLLGIGVSNEQTEQKINLLLEKNNVNLPCIIKRDWYY